MIFLNEFDLKMNSFFMRKWKKLKAFSKKSKKFFGQFSWKFRLISSNFQKFFSLRKTLLINALDNCLCLNWNLVKNLIPNGSFFPLKMCENLWKMWILHSMHQIFKSGKCSEVTIYIVIFLIHFMCSIAIVCIITVVLSDRATISLHKSNAS